MDTRRVVTGQQADGKSVIVSDEVVPATAVRLMPGSSFCQLWGSDAPVPLPTDGAQPAWERFFPPASGFRFLVWTIPPATPLPDDIDFGDAINELNEKLPGLVDFNELDAPGMHTTDTVDFDMVVSGEVWMELDDGQEVHLKTGDVVIQNGTRHRWTNKSTSPTVIATVLVGARRA